MMLASKPLALIAVSDGCSDGFFWISMDGDVETCNPQAFVEAFPETCVVVDGEISTSPKQLIHIAAKRIGVADVCLVDSYELLAFTKYEDVYRQILSAAIDRLPNHA